MLRRRPLRHGVGDRQRAVRPLPAGGLRRGPRRRSEATVRPPRRRPRRSRSRSRAATHERAVAPTGVGRRDRREPGGSRGRCVLRLRRHVDRRLLRQSPPARPLSHPRREPERARPHAGGRRQCRPRPCRVRGPAEGRCRARGRGGRTRISRRWASGSSSSRSPTWSTPRLARWYEPTSSGATPWCCRRRRRSTRSSPWPGTSASTVCSATATPSRTVVLTGEIERPIIWGTGKADVVQHAAAELGVDLARSYFYADGDEDVALMYLVGHPRPTNPGKRLAKVAEARGWPTLRFSSRSSSRTGSRVKQLAGAAALVPLVAGGTAVGLARRDRRAAVNFSTPRWLSALLAIHGVKLDVVGRDNLTAQRPALFVFNHRNNVDPFIAASLVERDFGSVADKELQRDPIIGALGKLADVVFIDWSDPESSADALQHVEDMASKGLSILLAPEGTRVDTTTVGPFDDGRLPRRGGGGPPDRADRHPQRRPDRRPQRVDDGARSSSTSPSCRRFRSRAGRSTPLDDHVAAVRQQLPRHLGRLAGGEPSAGHRAGCRFVRHHHGVTAREPQRHDPVGEVAGHGSGDRRGPHERRLSSGVHAAVVARRHVRPGGGGAPGRGARGRHPLPRVPRRPRPSGAVGAPVDPGRQPHEGLRGRDAAPHDRR